MFDCILRTVKEDGVLSLWRGNGSSVLRYYPSVALNFSLKGRKGINHDFTVVLKVPYATTVSAILFVSITLCAAFARAKQNFNLAATSVVLCGQKQMAKE
ncbi:hypothetical protein ACFE04_027026 [Oxalis oulophora]